VGARAWGGGALNWGGCAPGRAGRGWRAAGRGAASDPASTLSLARGRGRPWQAGPGRQRVKEKRGREEGRAGELGRGGWWAARRGGQERRGGRGRPRAGLGRAGEERREEGEAVGRLQGEVSVFLPSAYLGIP
jgi:hypothetical protein